MSSRQLLDVSVNRLINVWAGRSANFMNFTSALIGRKPVKLADISTESDRHAIISSLLEFKTRSEG